MTRYVDTIPTGGARIDIRTKQTLSGRAGLRLAIRFGKSGDELAVHMTTGPLCLLLRSLHKALLAMGVDDPFVPLRDSETPPEATQAPASGVDVGLDVRRLEAEPHRAGVPTGNKRATP